MSIEAIRGAFIGAAGGKLRLRACRLNYINDHQVLGVSGWHADGLPFAEVTPAFDGNPVERAGQMARDLIAAHSVPQAPDLPGAGAEGGPAMSAPLRRVAGLLPTSRETTRDHTMSQKGSGLARLVGGLQSFDAKADALATRLEAAMTRMEQAIPTTEQIVTNVEKGAGDLEAVNAQYSNGGPTGGSAGQSGG